MAPWPIRCFIAIFYVLRESHFLSGILLILEVQIVQKFQRFNPLMEVLKCRKAILNFQTFQLSLLHKFIQQSLNSGSAQVQILLAACPRLVMVRISDNGPGWKLC